MYHIISYANEATCCGVLQKFALFTVHGVLQATKITRPDDEDQLQLISCKCAVKVILDTLWQDKTGNENIILILTQTRTIHSRAARRI